MTEIRNQVDNYVTSFAQTVPAELPLNIKIASSIIPDSLNEFAYQDHGISATSNESQVHGRKMLRRVANRRSAQQSRARKKALMGDLKIENARLQKLADILDSQPELTFCIDYRGNIKFISDSALSYMKSSIPEESDDEPTHINQILTLESVETVLESVAELKDHITRSKANGRETDQDGCISSVQSVCYHDAHGFQVAGYVRCSRLIKRSPFDDAESSPPSDTIHQSKKSKTSLVSETHSDHILAIQDGVCPHPSHSDLLNTSSRVDNNILEVTVDRKIQHDKTHVEEEYVCVIRPADASFPYVKGTRLFSSLLSTASMVAHDLELRSSGYNNQVDPLAAGWSKEDYFAEGRRGSQFLFHSTDQQQCSDSSNGTKNSTSSETNSEDNGESDDHYAPI